MPDLSWHIFVCENSRDESDPRGSCVARGSLALREAFKDELKKQGLKSTSRANKAGCLDACKFGPAVVVYPEGVWYTVPTPEDAREIVREHFVNGRIVERLLMPGRQRAARSDGGSAVRPDGGDK